MEGIIILQTIFSAIAVYISTSIDYLFILLIIFSQSQTKKGTTHIYWGQYLGTGILVAVSLFAAYILNFIPKDWIIGLLGIIPITLGLHVAFNGDEDENEDELADKINHRDSTRLFWTVTLITLASGGDNLGIYIPYFTALSPSEIMIVLTVFAISVSLLCFISYRLANISYLSETLEKYERIIVPLVFIGLGIFILIENGTFQFLFAALN